MKFLISLTSTIISLTVSTAFSLDINSVKGFNLTEAGAFKYEANPEGQEKSEAQKVIDRLAPLGVNHIVLNVRAKMVGPYSSEIIPLTGEGSISKEAKRMRSLIKYIKGKDMTVGIRPIIFVLGPNGEFPYVENEGTPEQRFWWHGNIQPKEPNRWFESFRLYLDRYMTIAKITKVEEFTIGAELYSMTVGVEDQWLEHPFGFPKKWKEILSYTREKLGSNTRIMYDINFTDASEGSNSLDKSGGELERWRYRLVDLAEPEDEKEYQTWKDLVDFWNGLDAIGIDMYRSLAFESDEIPNDSQKASDLLTTRSIAYAQQLDLNLFEISIATDSEKPVILKEVGFRSVQDGYINPFEYASKNGNYNDVHQAIGYDALFRGFWEPRYDWFSGFSFWDIPLNPDLHGSSDLGFSPLGKEATENVIKRYFLVD